MSTSTPSSYAFTEHGVAMLSAVLRSPRAIQVINEIVRAFVRLRRLLATNADLARRLATLEKKYDAKFSVVFDAIRDSWRRRRSRSARADSGRRTPFEVPE